MNRTSPPAAERRPVVLMAGPMPPAVGGMVEVAGLLMGSSLAEKFRIEPFAINSSQQRTGTGRSALRHLVRLAALAIAVVRRRVALIHLHTCSGFTFYRNVLDVVIGRMLGAKIILHIHGGGFERFVADAGTVGRRIIRSGLSAANRVIVLSPCGRRVIAHAAPRANICVVPNGVRIDPEWQPTPMDIEAVDPPRLRVCRFLFLGPMTRMKGIDLLRDACLHLSRQNMRFHLDIAGPNDSWPMNADDSFNAESIAALRAAGCTVAIHGTVVGPERDAMLAACDCLVLPSRIEALPMVILEAGARGKPVIASDVGAIADILAGVCDDGLIPRDDADALADAMRRVADKLEWASAAGRALQERVAARFSLQRQAALVGAIYDDLLHPGVITKRELTPRGAA